MIIIEDWKLTRERVKNELYEKDITEIDILKKKILDSIKLEDKTDLYWQLSKKYTTLFWGYAEEVAIFRDTPRQEYYQELEKEYLWNSIYYREKCLQSIKEHRNIEANCGIFMDVGLKYRYFVKYNYEAIEEVDLEFERFGDDSNEKINIVINDLKYAERGVYSLIRYYEKEQNHEELYIWCEVMGDLCLIIQLLLMEGDDSDLLDNARQSIKHYKKSRDNLKDFAKPTTAYDGFYGLPYQTNFFEPLLQSHGFKGYSQSSINKMEFIEKKILKKEAGMDYPEYLDSPFFNNKTILNNRIEGLIIKNPVLRLKGSDFENWKIALSFIHDQILTHNYNHRDLNNEVQNWTREDHMQKWLQRLINHVLIDTMNDPSFYSVREGKLGGGECDHQYKGIPICDKWKRDKNAKTYPTSINEFIERVYKEHYGQIRSYAHDIKLAVMVVVDSRESTKINRPDLVKDCYMFKINKEDGIITAIFVLQVSDVFPSKRK